MISAGSVESCVADAEAFPLSLAVLFVLGPKGVYFRFGISKF